MPNSNNVYSELFASVTAFNVTTINRAMSQLTGQEERALKTRIFKLGMQFAKAIEWYGSEAGQNQMDETGAHFNDVDQFCKALCGKGKSWVYKGRKAYLFCEANESAFDEFLSYVKESVTMEMSEFVSMSVEHFNKWVSNECPEVYQLTEADRLTAESESETGESETGESESGDDTKYSFSMKNAGDGGACVRMDKEFNILAEDGDTAGIMNAISCYLALKGYSIIMIETDEI